MSRPMPQAKNYKKCMDCPAKIPDYGNRDRCPTCQDRKYMERKRATRRKNPINAA